MNFLNFTLTQVEYVLAVHRLGHFGKAAEECRVTQPTLSMQIKKLEDDLGVVLFDRSKKPILLTPQGALIVEHFKSLLSEAKRIPEILQQSTENKLKGELVVGMIPTVTPYLLPRALAILQAHYPLLQLRFQEMQTSRILEALESEEIDVGCLATPIGSQRLIEYPLYFEPFYLFCRGDHELASYKKLKVSQLKAQDLWLLEEGHCLRSQILDVCSLRKGSTHQSVQFESGNLETLKNIVSTFGGYTLLPALAAPKAHLDIKLISFERPIPSRQIGLIYRRKYFKVELIEALGEALIQSLPEEIQKLRERDLNVLPVEAG